MSTTYALARIDRPSVISASAAVEFILVAATDHNVSSGFGKAPGHRLAEALTAAGDESDAAGEVEYGWCGQVQWRCRLVRAFHFGAGDLGWMALLIRSPAASVGRFAPAASPWR